MINAFIHRELSWMQFNYRVLNCCFREDVPLNEKLNFLAISCSNLDEFISVRFATLLAEGDHETAETVLKQIHQFLDNQHKTYNKLVEKLGYAGKKITTVKKLSKKSKAKIEEWFDNSIFPVLTPIAIGSANEFPNLISGQTYIVVTVKDRQSEVINIIPIDKNLQTIYETNSSLVFIEDVILTYASKLFVKKEIESLGYFRVIKDANIILNHDQSKFILDRMNETLMLRKFSEPIFMEISSSVPKKIRKALSTIFNLHESQVYCGHALDYTRFSRHLLSEEHSYEPFTPAQYEVIEEQFSIFSELNERDILLHHPYDSYDTVLKFIEHAANDSDVLAIKMTLYRVSSPESPIIKSLMKAAERGKQVSVLVEIKARFNESMNIELVNKLKYAGINVILGEEYLKTHCKFCIVARKEGEGIRIYSHIATGNYNEKTAKIYTDLSYFTSKQKIGYDLINIFNILSGSSEPVDKLKKVFYAPVNLRGKLVKLIDREIALARKGKKAEIVIKVNSISDTLMVSKLYEAAEAGVMVTIICRGICSIVSCKHLRVKSIVGRFLEHSRIYYFRNGGHGKWYIGSADLLTRNLDKRIEILVALDDKNIRRKLKFIIETQIMDESNSMAMTPSGEFIPIEGDFNSHEWFIQDATSSKPSLKLPKPKKKTS